MSLPTAYASPSDMIARFDVNTLGDLCSDNGQQVDQISLLTDINMAAALTDAAGEVESSLLRSGMYAVADLTGLTGNAAGKLIRMVCEVAMCNLFARRPLYDVDKYDKFLKIVDASLKKLATGENVFNIPANITAGSPTIDGPSTLDYENLNMIRDNVRNYYPRRNLPNGR